MSFELGPLQRKWVEALRSGKYRQGRKALRSGNAWCCLGVACDVCGVESINSDNCWRFGLALKYGVLPQEVVSKMKFFYPSGGFGDQSVDLNGYHKLAAANDEGGSTFAEIADFIEAHPEAVFREPA